MKLKWQAIIPILFLLPLLSFVLLRREWLARLVASTCFGTIATINVLIYGLNPKSVIIGAKTPIKSERAKRNTGIVARAIIVVFGLLLLCVWSLPALYDSLQYCRHGSPYLKQIRGRVTSNSSPFGMYFLIQGIKVETRDGEQRENCDAIFLPRHANLGQTYVFLIAPKSTMLLDFESVSPSTNSY